MSRLPGSASSGSSPISPDRWARRVSISATCFSSSRSRASASSVVSSPRRASRSSCSASASRSSSSISERPRSRRSTSASLSELCDAIAAPEPPARRPRGRGRCRRSRRRRSAARRRCRGCRSSAGRTRPRPRRCPATTRMSDQRDSGRQRTSGGTSKLTWTSPSSWLCSMSIFVSTVAQPLDRGAEDRERRGRRVRAVQLRDLVADDRRPCGSARSARGRRRARR